MSDPRVIPCNQILILSCERFAVRFFLPDRGPYALCGPCTQEWFRQLGSWRHPELTEAQYRDLIGILEVMES